MSGKVLIALGMLCLLSSAKAKADDTAYAYCPAGEGYVYLYDSAASFQVLAYLKCGEKVEVESADRNVAKVRTADGKEGYVAQSSLTASLPTRQPQPAAAPVVSSPQPQPQPAAKAFAPFSGLGFGTIVPRVEAFGGFSYMNAGTSALANRQNLSGFESSVAYNVNRWLAGEANFGGYYKTIQILNVGTYGFHDYTIMGGPRFNIRKAFFHGLVGMDHLAGSTNFYETGASASDNVLAAALGGGVQWKFSRQLALRTSADYLLSRFEGATQSNFRVTAGIVFEAGSLHGRGIEVGQK
jgi:hypothetical protein